MTDPTPPQEPIDAEIVAPAEIPPVTAPRPDYDERGVPSFDYVRDRIEGRHAASQGAAELAAETPEGRTVEEQFTEREQAAKAKLEEIRRSLG
jgi:phage shock protein A